MFLWNFKVVDSVFAGNLNSTAVYSYFKHKLPNNWTNPLTAIALKFLDWESGVISRISIHNYNANINTSVYNYSHSYTASGYPLYQTYSRFAAISDKSRYRTGKI